MKTAITFLFLFSAQVFSQTFLGVLYKNSDPANSTNINLIKKITFTSTDITFILTDNTSVPKSISTINKITFGGTDGGNVLPVELQSFIAFLNGNIVLLEWRTMTEVNNNGFEIQKTSGSRLAGPWEKIGFVKGHVLSNSPKDYSYTDSANGTATIFYRIKQIDNDGKFQYSSIVEVEVGTPKQYALKQNFPNPFNPKTIIVYQLPIDGMVTLKVFDMLGREVSSLVNENKKAGSYEITFDGSRFASGVYICKMSSAKYSKSIKMLIMK
jgi:hypothetical protein